MDNNNNINNKDKAIGPPSYFDSYYYRLEPGILIGRWPGAEDLEIYLSLRRKMYAYLYRSMIDV